MELNKTTPISEAEYEEFERCLDILIADGTFPSFDEFCKAPHKWRENPEAILDSIDMSMLENRKELAKQKIFWRYGKESFTLGKLARVCKENGFKLSEVDMIPFRMKNSSGTGKDEIFVRVFPKSEMRKMGAIVGNV